MKESVIIDRGRGREIAGTRITVNDTVDDLEEGWHPAAIAALQARRTPTEREDP